MINLQLPRSSLFSLSLSLRILHSAPTVLEKQLSLSLSLPQKDEFQTKFSRNVCVEMGSINDHLGPL
jgi:hypothetical protein